MLITSFMQDSILEAEDTAVNKSDKIPAFTEFMC